eukprot:TRINITY_DN13428_c0_g1_i1.p1 TRINITY_DN13428_c0_g1~~TRINITY_DN13428_c0_g1_i1.p1  ORF type:complete len:210 (+),score=20.03 TRINITY_DN13428_c0_g1_i1:72-701(+)
MALIQASASSPVQQTVGLGAQQCEASSSSRTSPWLLGVPKCRPRCCSTRVSKLAAFDRSKHLLPWDGHSGLGSRRGGSRNVSTAGIPFFLGYTEGIEVVKFYSDWKPSEESIKSLYLMLACFFSWGCCVFGSMKDPFYESEEYRSEGGNGTQYWLYERQEVNEEKAREALWREELLLEMEEKMGELGDGDLKELPILKVEKEEREKELV